MAMKLESLVANTAAVENLTLKLDEQQRPVAKIVGLENMAMKLDEQQRINVKIVLQADTQPRLV
jgi:hypothetical protein